MYKTFVLGVTTLIGMIVTPAVFFAFDKIAGLNILLFSLLVSLSYTFLYSLLKFRTLKYFLVSLVLILQICLMVGFTEWRSDNATLLPSLKSLDRGVRIIIFVLCICWPIVVYETLLMLTGKKWWKKYYNDIFDFTKNNNLRPWILVLSILGNLGITAAWLISFIYRESYELIFVFTFLFVFPLSTSPFVLYHIKHLKYNWIYNNKKQLGAI